MMKNIHLLRVAICMAVAVSGWAVIPGSSAADLPAASPGLQKEEKTPMIPRVSGPWVELVGRPPLEKWNSPDAEPVDFAVFQSDDNRWHLISCIRKTTHPGSGRLLYRWTTDNFLKGGWEPQGIFLSSDPKLNHAEGRLQAPFHVRYEGRHYIFYNSQGAHLMISNDGDEFGHFGTKAVFPMGRDVCVLDDRSRSGKWIAYYTSPEKGINPVTADHTIRARTASHPEGPWSDDAIEIPPITEPPDGYKFVYAESPLVVQRGGYYYRFEQLYVFRSEDPLNWEGPPVAELAPRDPLKRLAPEIATFEGRDYLLAYQWRGRDPRGIYMAPLIWEEVP